MKRRIAVAAAVIFVIAACAACAEPVTLAYKFTKGEIDKYKMAMSMSMNMPLLPGGSAFPPMGMSMQMVFRQHTLDVLPDGSARIRVTYTPSDMKITGGPKMKKQPSVPNQSTSMVMTMTPDGRTTNVEGMDKALAASGVQNFDMNQFTNMMGQYAFLPAGPVEIGSSWNQTVPMPFTGGNMRVDSVLESYGEPIWSQPAAKINQKYSAYIDIGQLIRTFVGSMAGLKPKEQQAVGSITGGMDLNGAMDFYFAPAIGKVLKGAGNMTGAIKINMPSTVVKSGAPSALTMDIDMKMSLTRFK